MTVPLMIDRRFALTEILDALDAPVSDTTVWSALGTPFLDPAGGSDGGVAATLRRPIARVASSLGSPRSWMADAEKVASVRRERDRAIMDAIGSSLRRTAPWVGLRPGDLAQLRLFLAQAQHDSAERNLAAAQATDDFGPRCAVWRRQAEVCC